MIDAAKICYDANQIGTVQFLVFVAMCACVGLALIDAIRSEIRKNRK